MTTTVLRNTRRRLRLTQAGLARLLGVTPNTVARMERGEHGISEPVARLLLFIVRDIEAGGSYGDHLATIHKLRKKKEER